MGFIVSIKKMPPPKTARGRPMSMAIVRYDCGHDFDFAVEPPRIELKATEKSVPEKPPYEECPMCRKTITKSEADLAKMVRRIRLNGEAPPEECVNLDGEVAIPIAKARKGKYRRGLPPDARDDVE